MAAPILVNKSSFKETCKGLGMKVYGSKVELPNIPIKKNLNFKLISKNVLKI
jgi:hypothetical protein